MKNYYDDQCGCGRKPTKCECEQIVARAHACYARALECFERADCLIDRELRDTICCALEIVRRSLYMNEEATCMADKAQKMLEYCAPCCRYGKNIKKCEPCLEKWRQCNEKKVCIACEIKDLLDAICCKIDEYCEADRKGDQCFEEYVRCIHQDDCGCRR